MNRYFLFLLATAVTLYGAVAEAKLNVIASTPTLAALAKEVGGSRVEVASLLPEDKDLHSYTPRVILASLIGAADLLLYEGLGVESSCCRCWWVSLEIRLSRLAALESSIYRE